MADGRRPLIAANWKMNKTDRRGARVLRRPSCPRSGPSPALRSSSARRFSPLALSSRPARARRSSSRRRTCTSRTAGAFTGEVSPPMLLDAGVGGAVLGHSERRQLFGETDEALSRKVPAALEAGILPILCCGETEEERDADETERVLRRQIEAGLSRVAGRAPRRRRHRLRADLGDRHRSHGDAGAGRRGLRLRPRAGRRPERAGRSGGPDPLRRLGEARERGRAARPCDIDGALVGGASLDPGDFAAIVAAAG